MDRGTWWATVHGVTKSQTRLKQHSTQAHIFRNFPKLTERPMYSELVLLFNTQDHFSTAVTSGHWRKRTWPSVIVKAEASGIYKTLLSALPNLGG